MENEPDFESADAIESGSDTSTRNQFYVRTPAVAKAFLFLTAAALLLTVIFNFTMNGHNATLISEQRVKIANQKAADAQKALDAERRKQAQMQAQPFPASGSVQWRKLYPEGLIISILTITDKTGNGLDKIVTIGDPASDAHVADLYLEAGGQAKIALPATTYQMTLAEGKQWYGAGPGFGAQAAKTSLGDINLTRDYELDLKFATN